jgi:predicted GTPase
MAPDTLALEQTAPLPHSSVPIGTFADWHRVVRDLTTDLKRLRDFTQQLALVDGSGLIQEVLDRIEGDSFAVAIVGEFKRGKSTFINALLGVSVLPTDVLPTTATLNRVCYALTPRVVLRFKDGHQEDVPFDRLDAYVTKLTDEAETVAKTIAEATVYYPSPYCQNNVSVFDTPGLNDEAAMTEVTLSILPKIDAAIMVILAQAPFGEYEREFLENRLLTADLGRVIFVVNGIDNLNKPEEVDRVVKGIEDRIQLHVLDRAKRQFGADSAQYEPYLKKIGRPRVFGVSAYQAIEAKKANDLALLEKSRFPVLERELQRLLTERRAVITLQVPINRAITTSQEILTALNVRRTALALRHDEFETAYKRSEEEISSLRRRKSTELAAVRAAAHATLEELAPQIGALPETLKEAAGRTIDEIEIKPSDLTQSDALKTKLGKSVDAALRRASDAQATAIQGRINDALEAEVERLAEFAGTVDQLMARIVTNFGGIKAESRFSGSGEAWAAAIAILTGFGGVWSGYRQAGLRGSLAGGAASFGTLFAAGMVLAALSLPVSLPVIIALGIASILPGAYAAKWAFPKDRVERFRLSYKEAMLNELDQALTKADLKAQVQDQVRNTFENLRDLVSKEVDASLGDAERTLLTVRARYERESALSDAERKEIDGIEKETQRIGDAASRLSKQLVKIMEI